MSNKHKEETKDLVVKPSAPPPSVMNPEAWGSEVPMMGQDIVMAKILPMQLPSKLVGDGKAVFGEFRDSLTGTKIAGVDEAFAFLPFHIEKMWDIEEEQGDGTMKWVRSEPIVETKGPGYNDALPWKDIVEGKNVNRTRRLNFFGLLTKEIEEGTSIPYTLAFKSMSLKEGKKILTQMYVRNRRANLPPCGYVIILKGIKTSNDKGKFVVPTMELGPRATPEQVKECFEWYKMIKSGKVKEDDSRDAGESAITTDIDVESSEF